MFAPSVDELFYVFTRLTTDIHSAIMDMIKVTISLILHFLASEVISGFSFLWVLLAFLQNFFQVAHFFIARGGKLGYRLSECLVLMLSHCVVG